MAWLAIVAMLAAEVVLYLAMRGCRRRLPMQGGTDADDCDRDECAWCHEVDEIEREEIALYAQPRLRRGPFR